MAHENYMKFKSQHPCGPTHLLTLVYGGFYATKVELNCGTACLPVGLKTLPALVRCAEPWFVPGMSEKQKGAHALISPLTCLVAHHGLLVGVTQHIHQYRNGSAILHLAQAVSQLVLEQDGIITEGPADPGNGVWAAKPSKCEECPEASLQGLLGVTQCLPNGLYLLRRHHGARLFPSEALLRHKNLTMENQKARLEATFCSMPCSFNLKPGKWLPACCPA